MIETQQFASIPLTAAGVGALVGGPQSRVVSPVNHIPADKRGLRGHRTDRLEPDYTESIAGTKMATPLREHACLIYIYNSLLRFPWVSFEPPYK